MKKSFILHIDSLGILDNLSDEQAGKLFKEIKNYQDGSELIDDELINLVFFPFKSQFERDNQKYDKTCKARAIAGSKGGKQKAANASKCKQIVANVAENDSKNDNDSVSDNKKEVQKSRRFAPPSIQELQLYIDEKQLGIDGLVFIDYYETNGWYAGKVKMKDWKSAARNWSRRNETNKQRRNPTAVERVEEACRKHEASTLSDKLSYLSIVDEND